MGDRTAIRVMQSFGAPRETSNPYIHMLDEALRTTPGIEHIRFDRRRALVGRYDVLHLHWPETLLGGRTAPRRVARRLYLTALVTRLRLSRVAVVRTLHNVELPTLDSAWERALLRAIDRRADLQIQLNQQTHTREGVASAVIVHGHYRDWFDAVAPIAATTNTLAFVGLVRRYKGVENLIEAFSATRTTMPEWTLRIAGNATSADLASELTTSVADDERITMDLRYLSEEDFARTVMASAGVILPYRFMHNSGTALAALSLTRPVLVPRNDVNTSLAEEVGPGWVHQFEGSLKPADIAAFAAELSRGVPPEPPRLAEREWAEVGARHRDAYARAVRHRRNSHDD